MNLTVTNKNQVTAILILLITITDICIFLDIHLLRPILSFLVLSSLPGFLILNIISIGKIEIPKLFCLSVGLSISFLMFSALFLNQTCLLVGFMNPISTSVLTIFFTSILLILIYIVHTKSSYSLINFPFSPRFSDGKSCKFISPIIFPIVFPFLAIFGTYLMNNYQNNLLLLCLLFIIPLYVILIVCIKEYTFESIYPVSLLMISMSILLMHGLTSSYLNGRDVHEEYYAMRVVLNYQNWSISNYISGITACLSTSLLPAIYECILKINGMYIYKLAYQLIGSIIPLICYIIYQKPFGKLYAFLASLFFMSQINFIFSMQSAMRGEVAIFFFALMLMVLFDEDINHFSKRILTIFFALSVIVSHYTSAYIMFFLLFAICIVNPIKSNFKLQNALSASIVLICSTTIFLWYSQMTQVAFASGVIFAEKTLHSLYNLYNMEAINPVILNTVGMKTNSIDNLISVAIHDIGFVFIFIGVAFLSIYRNKFRLSVDYCILMIICLSFLLSNLFFPNLSKGYGISRLYQQLLVILSPAYVIGGSSIIAILSSRLRVFSPKLSLPLIVFLLILQFSCASYLLHQTLGNPVSEDLNREGKMFWEQYIYDQEIIATKWLSINGNYNLVINTDFSGYSRIYLGFPINKIPKINDNFFNQYKSWSDGYIYLRNFNVNDKRAEMDTWGNIKNLTGSEYILKSIVYSNGRSNILL